MLHIFPTQGSEKTGELGERATDALWLDLLNPTSDEVTNGEEAIGATLPSLGALSEVETSSRLSADSVYLIQGALLAQENMTNIRNLRPRSDK